MRQDRGRAIALRKTGKSYGEIAQMLGAPKSTLHYWFRDHGWSQAVKRRLTKIAYQKAKKRIKLWGQRAKRERAALYAACRERAKRDFDQFKEGLLFLSGLCLYWGEVLVHPSWGAT